MVTSALLLSEDYALMCNLPLREGSDSLRERPGYEYGVDGPEDPAEPFAPPYWDNYGGPAGPYDVPESVPLFNDNDYTAQQPPVRVPIHRPREHQPRPVDSFSGRWEHGPLGQWHDVIEPDVIHDLRVVHTFLLPSY